VARHRDRIVEQFTRQAEPFAAAAPIGDPALIELLVTSSGVGAADRVLDVGCGPGIVTCAFAQRAASAVGVDLVPAMLEQARARAAQLGIANVAWVAGDLDPLPFADASFDLVVTRFVLHHVEDPASALREMGRVLSAGGTLVACDIAPPARAAGAFNEMERLRDPSHVRALTESELVGLLDGPVAVHRTALSLELEAHLARSFPDEPGGHERLRGLFEASVAHDRLGVGAQWRDGAVEYAYPVLVAVAGPRG
jgi:ubiquinone/menaquinone biosynthesis C-methylase UbiE